MDTVTSLDAAARSFLASAFAVLREENVLPTSVFNPFLRVGRDYFGGTISGARGFAPFEARNRRASRAIQRGATARSRLCERIHLQLPRGCNRRGRVASARAVPPTHPALLSASETSSRPSTRTVLRVACCREVTSLTTEDGQAARVRRRNGKADHGPRKRPHSRSSRPDRGGDPRTSRVATTERSRAGSDHRTQSSSPETPPRSRLSKLRNSPVGSTDSCSRRGFFTLAPASRPMRYRAEPR